MFYLKNLSFYQYSTAITLIFEFSVIFQQFIVLYIVFKQVLHNILQFLTGHHWRFDERSHQSCMSQQKMLSKGAVHYDTISGVEVTETGKQQSQPDVVCPVTRLEERSPL